MEGWCGLHPRSSALARPPSSQSAATTVETAHLFSALQHALDSKCTVHKLRTPQPMRKRHFAGGL